MRTSTARHPTPAAELEERTSLALPLCLRRLNGTEKTVVLDLGPARQENVGFFCGHSCRLFIGDLYSSLVAAGAIGQPEPASEFASACRAALDLPESTRLDLILTWDLFDYLEPSQISELAKVLHPHVAPTTALYGSVSYLSRIPARPGVFSLLSSDRLAYRPSTIAQRQAPRHKEPQLKRALSGFQIDRTFLLRHGHTEYLFRGAPESAPAS